MTGWLILVPKAGSAISGGSSVTTTEKRFTSQSTVTESKKFHVVDFSGSVCKTIKFNIIFWILQFIHK